MNGWQADKRWSDVFLPEIKSVIGSYLICEAPVEEDQERNSDLMVLKLDSVRIACRIRRANWVSKSGEFTIREGRPSGVKTELTKIIEGWGDYLFYGFGSDDGKLLHWTLGDLKAFRLYLSRQLAVCRGRLPGVPITNRDGSSSFRVYRWNDVPKMVIGSTETRS